MPFAAPTGPLEAAFKAEAVQGLDAIMARLEEMRAEIDRHEAAAVRRIEAGERTETVLSDLRYAVATLQAERNELLQEAATLGATGIDRVVDMIKAMGRP